MTGVLAGPVTMEASATTTTGTLGAFTVVHGAAAQIALTGSTADLTSGTNRVLTATIQDAAGQRDERQPVEPSPSPRPRGAGSVSGTGAATASSGVATKTVTGVLAGSVTMEAIMTGLTTGTLGAFTRRPRRRRPDRAHRLHRQPRLRRDAPPSRPPSRTRRVTP